MTLPLSSPFVSLTKVTKAQLDQLVASINALNDALPVFGSATGTTAADGSVVISHGLSFTPSHIFGRSKLSGFGTVNAQLLSINTINSSTFTAWFLGGAGDGAGHLLPETVARTYSLEWAAWR